MVRCYCVWLTEKKTNTHQKLSYRARNSILIGFWSRISNSWNCLFSRKIEHKSCDIFACFCRFHHLWLTQIHHIYFERTFVRVCVCLCLRYMWMMFVRMSELMPQISNILKNRTVCIQYDRSLHGCGFPSNSPMKMSSAYLWMAFSTVNVDIFNGANFHRKVKPNNLIRICVCKLNAPSKPTKKIDNFKVSLKFPTRCA